MPTAAPYTPAQVAAINAARSANVDAGRNAYSGAGATVNSVATGQTPTGTGTPLYAPNPQSSSVSTSQVKAPVAVVSGAPAATKINTVVVPEMNKGLAGIQAQNTKIAANNDPYNFIQGETPETYNKRIAALKASSAAPAQSPPVNPVDTIKAKALETTMNTPSTGHVFAYDTTTGERTEQPAGTALPANLSLTPPANPVLRGQSAVASYQNQNGNTYHQYSDGTYGVTDAAGKYIGSATSQMFDQAKQNDPQEVLKAINSSLTSLTVGSVPLTDTQAAQINGLQSKFAQLVSQQTQDNANFVGGITIAQNLYGLGGSVVGLSAIKSAVDAGTQKIANLQSQSAAAIAEMQEKFDEGNYKVMFDKYNLQKSIAQDIQTQINRLEDVAVKAKNDALAEKHTQFQEAMAEKTYSLAEKKQAFDQYIQRAELSIKQKQEARAAYDHAIATQPIPSSTVPIGTNGKPSAAAQQVFLSKYPPNIQTQIKGLANYTLLPTSFPARPAKGQMSRADIVALAQQYDPTYDEVSSATRQAMQKNVTSGQYSQGINAANTLIKHLNTLNNAGNALGNTWLLPGFLNKVKNIESKAVGAPQVNNFQIAADAVASEAAKVFKGTGATSQEEVDNWRKSLSPDMSPAQQKQAIKQITELMAGRLATMSAQYNSTMGKPGDFQVLTDSNAKVLKNLGVDPATVDPTYGNSPEAKIESFYQMGGNNAKAIDAIMQAAPNATPDEVLYQLRDNGIDL